MKPRLHGFCVNWNKYPTQALDYLYTMRIMCVRNRWRWGFEVFIERSVKDRGGQHIFSRIHMKYLHCFEGSDQYAKLVNICYCIIKSRHLHAFGSIDG